MVYCFSINHLCNSAKRKISIVDVGFLWVGIGFICKTISRTNKSVCRLFPDSALHGFINPQKIEDHENFDQTASSCFSALFPADDGRMRAEAVESATG